MDEPTVADVRQQFPGWTVYRGVDQRWRARLSTATPPTQVAVGEDLTDLMEEMKRRIARISQET
jgi:hypothetical protein